jgi:hypothetical protein
MTGCIYVVMGAVACLSEQNIEIIKIKTSCIELDVVVHFSTRATNVGFIIACRSEYRWQ